MTNFVVQGALGDVFTTSGRGSPPWAQAKCVTGVTGWSLSTTAPQQAIRDAASPVGPASSAARPPHSCVSFTRRSTTEVPLNCQAVDSTGPPFGPISATPVPDPSRRGGPRRRPWAFRPTRQSTPTPAGHASSGLGTLRANRITVATSCQPASVRLSSAGRRRVRRGA
jgi:hypothetical protein